MAGDSLPVSLGPPAHPVSVLPEAHGTTLDSARTLTELGFRSRWVGSGGTQAHRIRTGHFHPCVRARPAQSCWTASRSLAGHHLVSGRSCRGEAAGVNETRCKLNRDYTRTSTNCYEPAQHHSDHVMTPIQRVMLSSCWATRRALGHLALVLRGLRPLMARGCPRRR